MPEIQEGDKPPSFKMPLNCCWRHVLASVAFVWESLSVRLGWFAGVCQLVWEKRRCVRRMWSPPVSGGWCWRDAYRGLGRGSSPGWWLMPRSLLLQVDQWDEITGGSTGGSWRSAASGAATWLCWKRTAPNQSSQSVTSLPPPWRACQRSAR